MGIDLENIDRRLTRSELQEQDINVQNISATFSITGEFDISALSETLPNSEYKPEKHRSLIYRPSSTQSLTILLPKSGRVTLTGATCKDEITSGVDHFQVALSNLGVDREVSSIEIENIVATTSFPYSLNLPAITLDLGLENVEYEPEQFTGAIYRSDESVILLFSSGKLVITSVVTYSQILNCYHNLNNKISTDSIMND